jgi:hypothetical protein
MINECGIINLELKPRKRIVNIMARLVGNNHFFGAEISRDEMKLDDKDP